MAGADILVFPNLQEMSLAAAKRFAELACLSLTGKGIFSAALSGGSTPKALYEILGSAQVQVAWRAVHLFQVDERSVPPDHPQSNYRMICETLLDHAPIPAGNFHRMPAEWPDQQSASARYAEELRHVLQPKEGGWPRFDLIFLGLGADGHTASLFPGTPAVHEQVLWVRENYVERLDMHRLTLTFPVLNAAREIIFLVAGHEKAETLREVVEGPRLPEKYPAQRIEPEHGRVSWYADRAAARLLAGARASPPDKLIR